MSQIIERRKRRRSNNGKYKLRVRYKYHEYKEIETEDYGNFSEMFKKYKGKMMFYCADLPPSDNGNDEIGFRLDSDINPEIEKARLKRYGRNKCWIDPTYKVDGRPVCLVYNAGAPHTPEYMAKYYQDNKKRIRNRNRERYWMIRSEGGVAYERMKQMKTEAMKALSRKWRIQVIQLLGGKCVWNDCGIEDVRILEIAHKNHDGFKEGKNRSGRFYRAILLGKRSTVDLFILCANHHKIHDLKEPVQ